MRCIDIELMRGGRIYKDVLEVDVRADLTKILTAARQLCRKTMSQKVRVCVGELWSRWTN